MCVYNFISPVKLYDICIAIMFDFPQTRNTATVSKRLKKPLSLRSCAPANVATELSLILALAKEYNHIGVTCTNPPSCKTIHGRHPFCPQRAKRVTQTTQNAWPRLTHIATRLQLQDGIKKRMFARRAGRQSAFAHGTLRTEYNH